MDFKNLDEETKAELLVIMSMYRHPLLTRGGLFTQYCSAYVPRYEDDINIAKRLFADCGIDMKIIKAPVDLVKRPVLRVQSFRFNSKKFQDAYNFMCRLDGLDQEISNDVNYYERSSNLQEILSLLRQEQNQK